MPPRARDADSVTAVEAIARIEHREAMELTAVENERFLSLLQTLVPPDWSRPTDCTRWDVRAVVAHVLGSACAQASPREFVHQLWSGLSLTRRIGGHHWVDGVNEAQVLARRSMSPSELVAEWQVASRRALRARRRLPAPVRSLRVLPIGPPFGWQPIGFLFDIGFTRDVWIHRVDIARAVGQASCLTSGHDGRIVSDMVAEWSALHHEPFTLHLGGLAGGTYTRGAGGEVHEIDAVEWCRIVSGRAPGRGVLRHPLPL
jgi:uncharacterized protein (TIGR03083 family)